jgi:hypothetical protein
MVTCEEKITSPNRTVTASPPVGGSGYTKHQSGYRPLWCFAPPHFFAPVKMLRIFPYRAQKKRQLQPERYVPFTLKLLQGIEINNNCIYDKQISMNIREICSKKLCIKYFLKRINIYGEKYNRI